MASRPMGRDLNQAKFLAVLLCMLGLSLAAEGKPKLTGQELSDAWKNYKQSQRGNEPALRFKYDSCFRAAARKFNLPLTLLLAVARGESDFNPRAVSKANALGIMQILWPVTAKELGITRKVDLFEPCVNIRAGARYLRKLLDLYDGDYHLALAAYNYGPWRIKAGSAPHAIPDGAQWYSAYIFDHLQYVLGEGPGIRRPTVGAPRLQYAEFRKYALIVFNRPFRARAFREYLQANLPDTRIDWFDKGLGRYEVVMVYRTDQEFDRTKKQLKKLGFRL